MGWEEHGRGVVFHGLGTLIGGCAEEAARSLAVSASFGRNGRFTYEVRLLETKDGEASLSDDETLKETINAQNALLLDEAAYQKESDRICLEFYEAGGYTSLVSERRAPKRGLLSGLVRGRAEENRRAGEETLRKLLAGESRRFAVLRTLNAKKRLETGEMK
jgi:hypothetical protein